MLPPDVSAAPAPSFAVLLLAWDETAPAVRAVLEAAQAPATTLPGVLVVVPAGPPPLAPEIAPVPNPAAEAVEATALAPHPKTTTATVAPPLPADVSPAAVLNTASAAQPLLATVSASPVPADAPGLAPVATQPPGALPSSPVPTPVAPSVHIVRLGSFSLSALAAQAGQPLPAPVWAGTTAAPATPYLGATAELVFSTEAALAAPARATNTSQQQAAASLAPAGSGLAIPARPAGLRLLGADGSASSVPSHLPVPTFFLSPAEEPDAPLDFDFPTASPLASPLVAEAAPESATWTGALAALRLPLAAEVPPETSGAAPADGSSAPAPNEETGEAPPAPSHAVLGPPAPLPNAPDLNFQIIQYARFAVPVALAEQPFGVLYAPSWPTWLAAQELRARTGRPLVLHLAALAAGPESADTATGWVAELQRQVLRRADLVLAETHALASRLRRELGLPAHAVRVVPAADTAGIARALRRVQVG